MGDKKVYKILRKKISEGVAGNIIEFVETGERFWAESDEMAKIEGEKRATKLGLGEGGYIIYEGIGD